MLSSNNNNSSNIKKFLLFSQKEAFLIFRETETSKKFLIFQGKELFSYFRKLLIFQEATPRARKMKKALSEKTSYISGNAT